MSDETDISVEYDDLISKHAEWKRGEESNASDAGVRRQAMGQFAKDTGIDNKALSQVRAGLKIKNEGKQLAWLTSMEALLPLAALRIRGNTTTEMDFDAPNEADDLNPDSHDNDSFGAGQAAYMEGVTQEGNPFKEGSVKHDFWKKGWIEASEADVSDSETEEFNEAVDEALEDA